MMLACHNAGGYIVIGGTSCPVHIQPKGQRGKNATAPTPLAFSVAEINARYPSKHAPHTSTRFKKGIERFCIIGTPAASTPICFSTRPQRPATASCTPQRGVGRPQ